MRFKKSLVWLLTLVLCLSSFSVALAAEELSKIVVSKKEVYLEIGDTESITSNAVYSDQKTEDVTIKTEWTSENSDVATVYAGVISGKQEGTVTIKASYMGKFELIQVKVSKKVRGLTKNKQQLELRIGEEEQIDLQAIYSDDTSEPVSNKADWSSDNKAVATVINGKVKGEGSGTATITAKYGKHSVTVPVTVEVIKRLEPSKTQVSLLTQGTENTEQIKLKAIYPNGDVEEDVASKATWSSSNEEVADVIKGKITAYSAGKATITAKYGTKTATIEVNVDQTLKLRVVPETDQSLFMKVDTKKQLKIEAVYPDGTTEDVTNLATWSSSKDSIAFAAKGMISAVGRGEAEITAKYGERSINIHVDVEVPRLLEFTQESISMRSSDEPKQLELKAAFANGETRVIPGSEAKWTTSDESVAYVSEGKLQAYKAGEATITATYGGKSASIKVEVDRSLNLSASEPGLFMKVGDKKDVKVEVIYADGSKDDVTSAAEWKSNKESVAYVSGGSITAVAVGEAEVTATYGGKSVTIQVDVEVPRRLAFDEESISMRSGGPAKELILTATYADGTEKTIAASEAKWSSSDESIAHVSGGKVQAYKSGEATITATYGGKTAKITVDVDIPRKLLGGPKTISLQVGEEQKIKLVASYADGQEEEVTTKAEWSSSSEKIVEVDKGVLTGVTTGTAKITAKYGTRTFTMDVQVGLANNLEANPRFLIMKAGESKTIELFATDASANRNNVTNEAEWKSSNPKVADVIKGSVVSYESGKATITAKYGGKTISIPVEVDVIQKVTADQRFLTLQSGEEQKIAVTVTFSDGTTVDVTEEAEWKTGNYKIADVKNGVVLGRAYGKTNITAKYGGKTVTIPVEVDTLKYLQTDVVSITMQKGEQKQVKATATYMDGTERDVTVAGLWSSSKNMVADVKDGIIRAHSKGKATITVKFGKLTWKVQVTVQ